MGRHLGAHILVHAIRVAKNNLAIFISGDVCPLVKIASGLRTHIQVNGRRLDRSHRHSRLVSCLAESGGYHV